MMNYEEFVQDVKKSVGTLLGDAYDVIVEEFIKTNGVKKTAIVIEKKRQCNTAGYLYGGFL